MKFDSIADEDFKNENVFLRILSSTSKSIAIYVYIYIYYIYIYINKYS